MKSDECFSEVRQTTKLTKRKRESIHPKGKYEPTTRTRQSTKGNTFNGRYLMELQKIEKPGNQQKSRVNKSTILEKRGVRCNTQKYYYRI